MGFRFRVTVMFTARGPQRSMARAWALQPPARSPSTTEQRNGGAISALPAARGWQATHPCPPGAAGSGPGWRETGLMWWSGSRQRARCAAVRAPLPGHVLAVCWPSPLALRKNPRIPSAMVRASTATTTCLPADF